MITQNDDISNEMDSHMRSADMEVASVNKFIDELHVSILYSFRHTLFQKQKCLNNGLQSLLVLQFHFNRNTCVFCIEGLSK